MRFIPIANCRSVQAADGSKYVRRRNSTTFLLDVQQRFYLEIGRGCGLRTVGNLENKATLFGGSKSKILIPLADGRLQLTGQLKLRRQHLLRRLYREIGLWYGNRVKWVHFGRRLPEMTSGSGVIQHNRSIIHKL